MGLSGMDPGSRLGWGRGAERAFARPPALPSLGLPGRNPAHQSPVPGLLWWSPGPWAFLRLLPTARLHAGEGRKGRHPSAQPTLPFPRGRQEAWATECWRGVASSTSVAHFLSRVILQTRRDGGLWDARNADSHHRPGAGLGLGLGQAEIQSLEFHPRLTARRHWPRPGSSLLLCTGSLVTGWPRGAAFSLFGSVEASCSDASTLTFQLLSPCQELPDNWGFTGPCPLGHS